MVVRSILFFYHRISLTFYTLINWCIWIWITVWIFFCEKLFFLLIFKVANWIEWWTYLNMCIFTQVVYEKYVMIHIRGKSDYMVPVLMKIPICYMARGSLFRENGIIESFAVTLNPLHVIYQKYILFYWSDVWMQETEWNPSGAYTCYTSFRNVHTQHTLQVHREIYFFLILASNE